RPMHPRSLACLRPPCRTSLLHCSLASAATVYHRANERAALAGCAAPDGSRRSIARCFVGAHSATSTAPLATATPTLPSSAPYHAGSSSVGGTAFALHGARRALGDRTIGSGARGVDFETTSVQENGRRSRTLTSRASITFCR